MPGHVVKGFKVNAIEALDSANLPGQVVVRHISGLYVFEDVVKGFNGDVEVILLALLVTAIDAVAY